MSFGDQLRKVARHIPGIKSKAGGIVIPVVRLEGTIGQDGRLSSGLNLARVAGRLEQAFKTKEAPCVALVINSPGGSPVQSNLIYQRVRALAEEKEKEVLIFVEDVAASGGYMIACAGDEIIIDQASIVGSIGVVAAGFGFSEAIAKIGVERRLYTAGESKAMLDPFSPEDKKDVARLKDLQAHLHEVFKSMVRARRGDKLDDKNKKLFSGDIWIGQGAIDVGLADKIGDLRGELRARFGDDVRMKLIAPPKNLFGRPQPASGIGAAAGEAAIRALFSELEDRSHWQRFGL
ncbi:MAG: S49 family peptidase [Pseudomonadota bacterium]